jgi:hypothetical protein
MQRRWQLRRGWVNRSLTSRIFDPSHASFGFSALPHNQGRTIKSLASGWHVGYTTANGGQVPPVLVNLRQKIGVRGVLLVGRNRKTAATRKIERGERRVHE